MCIVVPNLPNKNPLTSSRSKVSRWPGWSTLPGSRIQWTRALLVGLAFRQLVINSKWVIPETLLLKHAKTICGNVHGKAPVRTERDTRSEPELVHHIVARVWCCPCRRQYNIFLNILFIHVYAIPNFRSRNIRLRRGRNDGCIDGQWGVPSLSMRQ